MRKILSIIVIGCLLSINAFAEWGTPYGSIWNSTQIENTTGKAITTEISNTIIPEGTLILGWAIIGKPGINHEMYATIYDGPMTGLDEVIGETEVADNTKGGEWFPFPRTVEKGIFVSQGPGTIVTIYFQ